MEFDLSPPQTHKATPQKGRRAVAAAGADRSQGLLSDFSPLHDNDDISPISSLEASPTAKVTPISAPSRRSEGWMKSAKAKSVPVEFPTDEIEHRHRDHQESHEEDTLPVIPDLDDSVEDSFAQQIANAPSVPMNRVATFKELDSDLLKHTAFTTLEDVDLRCLISVLFSESEVREPDVEWTWDGLLAETASYLHERDAVTDNSQEEDIA